MNLNGKSFERILILKSPTTFSDGHLQFYVIYFQIKIYPNILKIGGSTDFSRLHQTCYAHYILHWFYNFKRKNAINQTLNVFKINVEWIHIFKWKSLQTNWVMPGTWQLKSVFSSLLFSTNSQKKEKKVLIV